MNELEQEDDYEELEVDERELCNIRDDDDGDNDVDDQDEDEELMNESREQQLDDEDIEEDEVRRLGATIATDLDDDDDDEMRDVEHLSEDEDDADVRNTISSSNNFNTPNPINLNHLSSFQQDLLQQAARNQNYGGGGSIQRSLRPSPRLSTIGQNPSQLRQTMNGNGQPALNVPGAAQCLMSAMAVAANSNNNNNNQNSTSSPQEQSIQSIATQAAAAMAAAMAAQQLLTAAASICGMDLASLSNFALMAGQQQAAGGQLQQHLQSPEQLMAAAVATAAFLSPTGHHLGGPEDLTVAAAAAAAAAAASGGNQQQQQPTNLVQPLGTGANQLGSGNGKAPITSHLYSNNNLQNISSITTTANTTATTNTTATSGRSSASSASSPLLSSSVTKKQRQIQQQQEQYAALASLAAAQQQQATNGLGPNQLPADLLAQLELASQFAAATASQPIKVEGKSLLSAQSLMAPPDQNGHQNANSNFNRQLVAVVQNHLAQQQQQHQLGQANQHEAATVSSHLPSSLFVVAQQHHNNSNTGNGGNNNSNNNQQQQHHNAGHQSNQQQQPHHPHHHHPHQQHHHPHHHQPPSARHHRSHHLLGGHHHHSSIQTQQQLLATKGFNPLAAVVGQQTEILTPTHLRKAKLMFFYVRYPNSSTLKESFRDVHFNKNNTAQLVKWFSNFREFYYIQMEKFARDAVADARIQCKEAIKVNRDHELINQLNNHYNKNRHIELPEEFREVVEETLQHFFDAIYNKRDQEQSWKKSIYKIIARLDKDVPELFKTDAFNEHLE